MGVKMAKNQKSDKPYLKIRTAVEQGISSINHHNQLHRRKENSQYICIEDRQHRIIVFDQYSMNMIKDSIAAYFK
jgi:hypothetical protein